MRSLCFVWLFSMAAMCRSQSSEKIQDIDSSRLLKDLQLIAAEPHPMGSPRNAVIADYLDKEMKAVGLTTGRFKFEVQVPDPEFLGREASMLQKTTLPITIENVTAKFLSPDSKACVFLLGSHYDSKRLDGATSIGANDSGSSSAALLEIMRRLSQQKPNYRCHVMAVWFDGEEAYLPQWRDGETQHPARQIDNTYGSRDFVSRLKACEGKWCLPDDLGGERVEGLILLDMIGSAELRLSPESNSSPELMGLAKELDRSMFAGKLYGSASSKQIEDDHIPFLEKGIPAVDLIGFETLDHWHQPSDTIDTLSVKSIEQASQLTEAMLARLLGE